MEENKKKPFKKPFSLRLESDVIDAFQKQAERESVKQGDLFEKMLNKYLGKPLPDESQIPFNINLFRFDQINNRKLVKTTYSGYGIPLYVSEIFRYFGVAYFGDRGLIKSELKSDIDEAFQNTELQFVSHYNHQGFSLPNDCWLSFDSNEKIERFKKDFKIENPQDYRYMSAFRVFKDFQAEKPLILVNEHLYLIGKNYYDKIFSEAKVNIPSGLNPILPKDMPFAVSSIFKLKDESQIDKLQLDREYLHTFDVENIKNALNPTVSANSSDIDEIIDRYSIL